MLDGIFKQYFVLEEVSIYFIVGVHTNFREYNSLLLLMLAAVHTNFIASLGITCMQLSLSLLYRGFSNNVLLICVHS